MSKKIRRWLIGSGAAAAILGAAVALLPYWMPTRWIRDRIERELAAQLGVKVQIDSLALHWTGARIGKLQIGSPAAFGPKPMLVADGAVAQVSLLPLLRGKLDQVIVKIKDPALRVVRAANGQLNLQALGPAAGKAAPTGPAKPDAGRPLPLGSVHIAIGGASVEFQDLQAGVEAFLPPTDLTVQMDDPSRPARVSIAVHLPSQPAGTIAVEAAATPFKNGILDLRAANLEATVRFDRADPWTCVRALSAPYKPAGLPLDGEVKIASPDLKRFTVKGGVRLAATLWEKTGSGEKAALPPISVQVEAAADLGAMSAALQRLKLDLGVASIEGTGSVEAWDAPPRRKLQANLTLLADLNAARETAAGFVPAMGTLLPKGTWSGNASFKQDPENLSLVAQGTVSDFQAPGLQLPPGTLSYTLDVSAAPQAQRYTLNSLDARLGPVQVQGAGRAEGPFTNGLPRSVDAKFTLKSDDLGAALPARPAGEPAAMKAGGKLLLEAQAKGDGERIPISIQGRGSDIQLEGGPLSRPIRLKEIVLDQSAVLKPGEGRVDDLKMEFRSDFLRAWISKGSIQGFPDRPQVDLTLSYGGDLEKLQEVAALFAAFPPDFPTINGKMAGTSSVQAGSEEATADFHLKIDQVSMTARDGAKTALEPILADGRGTVRFKQNQAEAAIHSASAGGVKLKETSAKVRWGGKEGAALTEGKLGISIPDLGRAVQTARAMNLCPPDLAASGGLDVTLEKIQGSAQKLTAELSIKGAKMAVGGLSFDGTIQGKDLALALAPGRIESKGTLNLGGADLAYGASYRKPAERVLAIAWDAAWADPVLTLTRLKADLGATSLKLSGSFDRSRQAFTAKVEETTIDLEELAKDLPGLAKLSAQGKVVLSAGAQGTLDAPGGSASVALADIVVGRNKISSGRLALKVEKGALSITEGAAIVNEGKVALAGSAELWKPEGPAPSHLELTLAQVPFTSENPKILAYVNPLLGSIEGGASRATIDLPLVLDAQGKTAEAVKGTVHTPGPIALKLGQGKIEGSPVLKSLADKLQKPELSTFEFDSLEEQFEIKDRKIHLLSTQFNGKECVISMTGWTSFEGEIDYVIFLKGKLSDGDTEFARALRAVNDAGGIKLTGTVSEPKADLDFGKFLLEIGKSKLQDTLKDKGADLLKDFFKRK